MRMFVGITDFEWYRLLAGLGNLEEVNFWQPGGTRLFRALEPGELFLFKLHAPRHSIVGGGFFGHSTLLPVDLAWDAFGQANGARTLAEMRSRIEQYRRAPSQPHERYTIGCILLEQPFFLPENRWLPTPPDWHPNVVQGKSYDAQSEPGRSLWLAANDALRTHVSVPAEPAVIDGQEQPRYAEPTLYRPRLGQGTFRIVVTDAYERRCAVTSERVLPVLEAAHIHPYATGGAHRIENGLLLRSDLHTLFDRGYVTVTPDLRFEVSRRLREDFENGRDYYALHGGAVRPPALAANRPSGELLRWHNEEAFLG
jgi:putative restriction endonuclease